MASTKTLFSSCEKCFHVPQMFCVGGGCSCIITVSGLEPNQEIPLQMWVGGVTHDEIGAGGWVPATDLDGNPLVLTPELGIVHVKVPGRYSLDVSLIPLSSCPDKCEPCVIVGKQKVDPCEAVLLSDNKEILACLTSMKAALATLAPANAAMAECIADLKKNQIETNSTITSCLVKIKDTLGTEPQLLELLEGIDGTLTEMLEKQCSVIRTCGPEVAEVPAEG